MSVMRFLSRCGNDKCSDGGHDLQKHNESTCLTRLCCGVWVSIADGVVVRIVVSVIAILCVFSLRFFGLFCAVCVDDYDMDFLTGFRLFLVRHTDGRKVQRHRAVSNFANFSPRKGWCALLWSFSLVCLKFRIRCVFNVCVISWPHKKVEPEECAMVFQHIFCPWHQHHQVCFHFKCVRRCLHAWADVDSMMVLIFLCGK